MAKVSKNVTNLISVQDSLDSNSNLLLVGDKINPSGQ